MRLVEDEWERTDVEAHPGKRVDGAKDTEVQGYHVGARSLVAGVAVDKRLDVLQVALHLLFGRRVVAVYWVERLVGKGVRKERLPGEVFLDILFAAITLPLAEFDLSMPFCTRVGSDSSTTGLGRSWTLMLSDLVERCCRQSDRKRIYTNLSLDGGVEVSEGRCELEEVDMQPEDCKWRDTSMRAFPEHITLGESDAANWRLEECLKRPSDFTVVSCTFLTVLL